MKNIERILYKIQEYEQLKAENELLKETDSEILYQLQMENEQLKAENEQLKAGADELRNSAVWWSERAKHLEAENERLETLLWEQWSRRWVLELKDVPEMAFNEPLSRKNFELYLKTK